MNNIPAMSAHCAEMMGDVQTSSPEFKSPVDQSKNSCGNHYACLGLELKSANLTMIELRVELNVIQALSAYTRQINDGYFALPDPPPRYTL
ncbi:MAG: hypothetical protein KGO49_03055 [Gammaproteobacteria bacterium]|nr:hypothetical protein [Gammaproteobacteria bacterium]